MKKIIFFFVCYSSLHAMSQEYNQEPMKSVFVDTVNKTDIISRLRVSTRTFVRAAQRRMHKLQEAACCCTTVEKSELELSHVENINSSNQSAVLHDDKVAVTSQDLADTIQIIVPPVIQPLDSMHPLSEEIQKTLTKSEVRLVSRLVRACVQSVKEDWVIKKSLQVPAVLLDGDCHRYACERDKDLTPIAQAIAAGMDAQLFKITSKDSLSSVFDQATQCIQGTHNIAVVFINNLEKVQGSHVDYLIEQMNNKDKRIFVLAATNNINFVDRFLRDPLLASPRFETVYLHLPDYATRLGLLHTYDKRRFGSDKVSFKEMAKDTCGWPKGCVEGWTFQALVQVGFYVDHLKQDNFDDVRAKIVRQNQLDHFVEKLTEFQKAVIG